MLRHFSKIFSKNIGSRLLLPALNSFAKMGKGCPKAEIYISTRNNIHFNLATEEYLFEYKRIKVPTLFLWRNTKCIVIGRHQNPWKECFLQEMSKNDVKLARRRSGGGAVYQDVGNSVFTFLTPVAKGELPLASKEVNNKILVRALKNLGVKGKVTGRNDIEVNGSKVSGSAYKVDMGKGRGATALHHGTMLISVDMGAMKNYLNPSKPKLQSKGIKSVVSRVTNLNNVRKEINHFNLCHEIQKEFIKQYRPKKLTTKKLSYSSLSKIPEINKIYKELTSRKWLFAKTPDFTNQIETRFNWGTMDFYFNVKEGVVKSGKLYSDCLWAPMIDEINVQLNSGNFKYSEKGVRQICKSLRDTFENNLMILDCVNDLEKWWANSI